MHLGANTQQYTASDYDYGMSSGLNRAAMLVSIHGMRSTNPEVQAFANEMMRMLAGKADEVTDEIRDREQVAA
ncbi:hypothetical protein [Corynebacterium variabile]|uniref:hypothetical protein n=1 Tax=Corynebacterium variabile TaxID=1727 RepID=UPI002FE2E278